MIAVFAVAAFLATVQASIQPTFTCQNPFTGGLGGGYWYYLGCTNCVDSPLQATITIKSGAAGDVIGTCDSIAGYISMGGVQWIQCKLPLKNQPGNCWGWITVREWTYNCSNSIQYVYPSMSYLTYDTGHPTTSIAGAGNTGDLTIFGTNLGLRAEFWRYLGISGTGTSLTSFYSYSDTELWVSEYVRSGFMGGSIPAATPTDCGNPGGNTNWCYVQLAWAYPSYTQIPSPGPGTSPNYYDTGVFFNNPTISSLQPTAGGYAYVNQGGGTPYLTINGNYFGLWQWSTTTDAHRMIYLEFYQPATHELIASDLNRCISWSQTQIVYNLNVHAVTEPIPLDYQHYPRLTWIPTTWPTNTRTYQSPVGYWYQCYPSC